MVDILDIDQYAEGLIDIGKYERLRTKHEEMVRLRIRMTILKEESRNLKSEVIVDLVEAVDIPTFDDRDANDFINIKLMKDLPDDLK